MSRTSLLVVLSCVFLADSGRTDERPLAEIRQKAIQFLSVTQEADGSWTKNDMVGVTGLVTASLLRSGLTTEHPLVAAGLKNLLFHAQTTGGFYSNDSLQRNYETCITVFALSEANGDGRYDVHIKGAEMFLRDLQWDKGEGIESSDPGWGGGGYGKHQRPDLSNTQYLMEALRKAGVKSDDAAMQKILQFVSRTQNLETSANDTKFSGLINDGASTTRQLREAIPKRDLRKTVVFAAMAA